MDTQDHYEGTPFQGGVPIPGVPTSAEEEGPESEEELDVDFIRHARGVVVAPHVATATTTRRDAPSPPASLTFHLPNRVDTLGSEGETNPGTARSLNQSEQPAEEMDQSFSTDPEDPLSAALPLDYDDADDAGQAAAGLLKGAIPLTIEGSALHASILAA